MGQIKMPPNDIRYPHPKAVGGGKGFSVAKIIGRAMEEESFPEWGDYMRVLDLVEFQQDEHHAKPIQELRFCQYYRKAGGTDKDWIFGQGAGHMSVETFFKLIHKAANNPNFGSFKSAFKDDAVRSVLSREF